MCAMNAGMRRRVSLVLVFCLTVSALAAGVWRYGYHQGLDQLELRGQADLALASDRLVGQLQRYRDLSVLMAGHPAVQGLLAQGTQGDIGALLQEVADKAAALDVLVVDRNGAVLAAAQQGGIANLGGQPHVRRALRGALGWGHGTGLPLTPRAFYHAASVFGPDQQVTGAVVVVTDLSTIDYAWRGSNPATLFTDADGVVFISNRSELLFWQRPEGAAGLIPPSGDAPDFAARGVGRHEIWQLGWGPYLPQRALHLTQALPVIGMTGEILLDVAQARRFATALAAAVAALCLAFGSLLFVAEERRRTLAEANKLLEGRVAKRTAALRDSNARLLREAHEREEAQAALKRAQADLVQAGKLSALGQMSAGISHELNQPLMAIRSFAENGLQFIDRGTPERARENLSRISDMGQRMGRIIQNLRAFARQDSGTQEAVELGKILHTAVELTQAYVEDAGVTLQCAPQPCALWVRGGEVRLGQVFVNLITNAVDAMSASPDKVLEVSVVPGDPLVVRFRDTGPGIEMPDKVFDPFYTTKSVGPTGGMGLGLSISYGIVQSFGGQIRGENCDGGGALFSVTLEPAAADVVAA